MSAMESSPAKRRKTSPTTSVPANAPTTPSRIPVLRQDGPSLTRPSFASPTKASLARHNPQLLAQPATPGVGAAGPKSGINIAIDPTDGLAIYQAIVAAQSGEAVGKIQETESLGSTTQGSNDAPAHEETPSPTETTERRSMRSVGGAMSAKPRRMSRSPVKQTEKATESEKSIQSTNEIEKNGPNTEDNINPLGRIGLRRSPRASRSVDTVVASVSESGGTNEGRTERPLTSQAVEVSVLSHSSKQQEKPATAAEKPVILKLKDHTMSNASGGQDEPELPLTPTQQGLADPVVTTPPSGIHDTPSKRARRSKKLAEKLKSSPLKPRGEPHQEQSKEHEANIEPKKIFKPRRSPRFSMLEDPYAAKKKVRDDLLKELQQLQADVALANQENERLRKQYESGRTLPSSAPNPEEILSLLLRSTVPEPSPPKPKPTSLFYNIRSFLPFSGRRKAQPAGLPVPEKPTPSHLPMTPDHPLTHLQLLAPIEFSSDITLLPAILSESDEDPSLPSAESPILQKHLISASSPNGLFSARLSMIVDTQALSITSLEVEKLDPSARAELGTFIRNRMNVDSESNPIFAKDISVICWAMGRWVEVSILRARFWCAIEGEFGSAEVRKKSVERYGRRKKRKRKQGTVLDIDDEDAENEDQEIKEAEIKKHKWTRKQLLPQMGRTTLQITDEEEGKGVVGLLFEWRIGFDWTGEVESVISATARMPNSWQQKDERGSLAKVPETFNRLVKERGPLGAVRTIVGLVMH